MSIANEFGPGEIEEFYASIVELNKKIDDFIELNKTKGKEGAEVIKTLNKIEEFKEGFQAIDDFIKVYQAFINLIFDYSKIGGQYEYKMLRLVRQKVKAELDWPDIKIQLKAFFKVILNPDELIEKYPEIKEFVDQAKEWKWKVGKNKNTKSIEVLNVDIEEIESHLLDLAKLFTQGISGDLTQKIGHSIKELIGGKYRFNIGEVGRAIKVLEEVPFLIILQYYKAWGIEKVPTPYQKYKEGFDTLLEEVMSGNEKYNQVLQAAIGKKTTELDPRRVRVCKKRFKQSWLGHRQINRSADMP